MVRDTRVNDIPLDADQQTPPGSLRFRINVHCTSGASGKC